MRSVDNLQKNQILNRIKKDLSEIEVTDMYHSYRKTLACFMTHCNGQNYKAHHKYTSNILGLIVPKEIVAWFHVLAYSVANSTDNNKPTCYKEGMLAN